MTHQTNECIHCKTKYTYQSSGWGCNENYNHHEYCPDCWKVISKLLEARPKKFEYRQVGTDEVTLTQLLRWEHKAHAKDKADNIFRLHRILPGLMCMETGDSQHNRVIQGQDKYEGIKFWLSEWKLSPEYTIRKELYWNLAKNEPENGEHYRESHTKLNPSKHYPPKKPKNEVCTVIPIHEPVGLTFAMKYLCEGQPQPQDKADIDSTNKITSETGAFEGRRTLDDLTEDEFSDVRQLIYEKYNPSDINQGLIHKLYRPCEKIFCYKEEHNFHHTMKYGNRFAKLLATARTAKARYKWYKQFYQTFKDNI